MSRTQKNLSVVEAVDVLAKVAEIDHNMSSGELASQELQKEKIRATFRVLHGYLKALYENDKDLLDPNVRKGVHAIMGIASEAAKKIDRFTLFFQDMQGGVRELQEFQDFQEFYLRKIQKRFAETLAAEEAWEAQWGEEEVDLFDIPKRGLKDLETVRKDKSYELFYIRKEDGLPFFHRNLIRHIRLVGEFDESIAQTAADDPFLQLSVVQDRELHCAARSFVESHRALFEAFYHDAVKDKDNLFMMNLRMAMMALFLAANPRNQIEHSPDKPALLYFSDFHGFLREALRTEEYKRADVRSSSVEALQLTGEFVSLLFTRQSKMNNGKSLVWKVFEKYSGHTLLAQSGKNPLWLWNKLIEEDEKIRELLRSYPNGPMMKTLDILRLGEERDGFDPILQANLPHSLYHIAGGSVDTEILHLPAPVYQRQIHQAAIVDEFYAFLQFLSVRDETLLMINLQDRTSWQERARAESLESLQRQAAILNHFYVITLPTDTEFYTQSGIYEGLDDAASFKQQLLEQFTSGEACGYFIPFSMIDAKLTAFVEKSIGAIHSLFFADKLRCTRKNRLDFIVIFYLFLTLFFVIKIHPTYLSFTCKDGIDNGAVMSGMFFTLIKLFGAGVTWSKEEKMMLIDLLYTPAFMLRERIVDKARLDRCISAMSLVQAEIDEGGKKLITTLNKIFPEPLLNLLQCITWTPSDINLDIPSNK
jgi:hypothetical protein